VSDRADVWSGRVGFIFAAVGSAVGIGSIWKFPYEVGSNGGGAFLLFYVTGLVFIVVPLMFAEFAIGRHGRGDSAGSIAAVAAAHGADRRWAWAGLVGVLTGFLILSFYSVIGGWTVGYAVETAVNGLPGVDPRVVRARYDAFLASPLWLLLCHALFMSVAAAIVARGVTNGIEAASKVLMPLLVALMVALAAYSILHGDLAATLRFLLRLDPAHLTARTALEALGLGFFSIGVGMGVMITYAAYAGPGIDLKQVAIVSVMADGAISLLAGLAVFPIVFAHGLDPAAGPGLVFVTLPLAFARMPFGAIAAQAFFGLLFVAALASAISMLELVVALLMRRLGWRRVGATVMASVTCFIVGITTVLSFNVWAHWYPLARLAVFQKATVFDLLDHVTSNVLLPVGGLAIALFAGWVMPQRVLAEALRLGPAGTVTLSVTVRYVVPAAITAATLSSIFI
jgi:NSS family neurotransmitter:Na+ symporter